MLVPRAHHTAHIIMQWDFLKKKLISHSLVLLHVGMNLPHVIFLYLDKRKPQKKGVKKNNGTPREFTTITVTDGIAMGHEGMKSSLVSREIIADSVEVSIRGHCYDGLVGNCRL